MFRRLSPVSLLLAWLCASGAMLDVAQVIAWANMFAGYSRTESFAAAASDTFDPQRPCALCRAVGKARDARDRSAPAVPSAGSDKIVLICEPASPFVARCIRPEWPEMASSRILQRIADVPVPPPRAALA